MCAIEPKNATDVATGFLTRLFFPDETIALLIRHGSRGRTLQRIARLERILDPDYLCWLAAENSLGQNLHVSANPLLAGSRKRTKDSVASARHLYLDLDQDGEVRLASLLTSDRVPIPTAIVSTSDGKYQVLWRVEGFGCEQQEAALKLLAQAFGGDPACTDCNRMLRLPGFLNWKYVPAYRVSVDYPSPETWTPRDFRLDAFRGRATPMARPLIRQPRSGKDTHSERDWAWVLDKLAHGADAAELTRMLAERRSEKPNPLYYAQRTVDVASAKLWLRGGIDMEDVIRMLERRRRLEIPAAAVRAREIAQTAERMIARSRARGSSARVESAR
jgi:hypothetical protein